MPVTITKQKNLWNKVLSNVEKNLSKDQHTFSIFYSDLKLINLDNNKMDILTPSPLVKAYFSSNDHCELLKSAINDITETKYTLNFVLANEVAEIQPAQVDIESVKKEFNLFPNCQLNKKYTFDNFVQGECNKEALTAALIVSDDSSLTYNPLFIYSHSGLGKTHLLHAIGNYYQEKHPEANIMYISTDTFLEAFVNYVRGYQDQQNFYAYFDKVDLLLVDDIQFLSNKEKTSEQFFNIFTKLVNKGKQIVLTSDRHPRDLKGLEERLVSRFIMGLCVSIKNPDTETALEILKRKIIARGLKLGNYDEDGLLFLAETFSKNVRELEGALNRLLFHTVTINSSQKVTLSDIQDALSIMIPKSDKKRVITEEDIINEVASYYHLSTDQILSPVRNAQIALARRIAMYECRLLLNSPYKKIGQIFHRDHSTVITGVDKVGTEIKTNLQLANAVNDIKKALKKA